MKFRMGKVYSLIFVLSFLLLGSSGCSDTKEIPSDEKILVEEVFTPVIVSAYNPSPPVLGSDNKYYFIYGLMLTNTRDLPATIENLEVLNGNVRSSPLLTLKGDQLLAYLYHLDSRKSESREIGSDASRLLFITLIFDDEKSIPTEITHRISAKAPASPGSKSTSLVSYIAGHVNVPTQSPVVISPPLEGKGWLAINGCCSFKGVHQASLMPVNGELYNSQRFATGYMMLDDQGRLVQGDPSIPKNWVCYNEKVFAVLDGKVVSVLDGLPDQPPGTLPDPQTINMKNYTGNHIILRAREGVYVFYAHLRNGSIRVKVGDQVISGDHIANLGNSGNTSAPHLHLHLMSTRSPIGSKPVPYTIDSFNVVGTISPESFYGEDEKLEDAFDINSTSKVKPHLNQVPLDMTVVEFRV